MIKNGVELRSDGDLILVSGTTKQSKINKVSQTVDHEIVAKFSHVAMVIGGGTGVFHADTNCGVDFMFFNDFLERYPSKYSAYRHPTLYQWQKDDYKDFYSATVYFLGQDYIRELQFEGGSLKEGVQKFLDKPLEYGETFCSLLINDFLKRKSSELALKCEKPHPVDFQKEVKKLPWENVTTEHERYHELFKDNEDMRDLFYQRVEGALTVRDGIKDRDETIECLEMYDKTSKQFERLLGIKETSVDNKFPIDELPVEIWDQKYGKKKKK